VALEKAGCGWRKTSLVALSSGVLSEPGKGGRIAERRGDLNCTDDVIIDHSLMLSVPAT
jgi:hypothetical protein